MGYITAPHFSRLLRHAWGYGGHILDSAKPIVLKKKSVSTYQNELFFQHTQSFRFSRRSCSTVVDQQAGKDQYFELIITMYIANISKYIFNVLFIKLNQYCNWKKYMCGTYPRRTRMLIMREAEVRRLMIVCSHVGKFEMVAPAMTLISEYIRNGPQPLDGVNLQCNQYNDKPRQKCYVHTIYNVKRTFFHFCFLGVLKTFNNDYEWKLKYIYTCSKLRINL